MGNARAQATTSQVTGVDVRATSIRLQFTLPDGTRPRITLKDAGGRPLAPTVSNVRAAERTMHDIRASIKAGAFDLANFFPELAPPPPAEITVAQQLDAFLAGFAGETSTKAGYVAAANFWRLAPADAEGTPLGSVPLDELVFSQCRHALAAGSSRHRRGKVDADRPPKPLSPKTCNNYLAVLRAALELAVDDGVIAKNPAGTGDKLRRKVQKPAPDPLELEEFNAVVNAIGRRSPEAGDYAEFWGSTGLRTSELNGMKWSDVDLRGGYVHIHQVNVRGVEKNRTKTHAARDVPLDDRARAALERQRARTQLAGEHVWVNPQDGLPWNDERDFRRSHWLPALQRLGIRYRRPYCLRHTRASVLLAAGVAPGDAAQWLGHSLEVFFKRYAKWLRVQSTAASLAKVNALVVPAQSKAAGAG